VTLRSGSGTSSLVAIAALVVVPFLGWVVWAGLQQADQDVRWETVGFDNGPADAANSSVQINFDVFYPAGSSLECTVRALDADGIEVGRADVPIEAEGTSASVDYSLAVTARPSSAFVQTCRLAD